MNNNKVSSDACRVNGWIIVAAGMTAGVLDLVYAVATVVLHGMPPAVVPMAIASGVLGPAAFHGGAGVAILGLALHMGILVVAAGLYALLSRRIPLLGSGPIIPGMVYGLLVYLFMHLVVLPLSLAPPFKNTVGMVAMDIAVHVLVLGPVLSLAAKAVRPGDAPREYAAF
jgi:uncharacterized membrane protein YagU involved in acid resistance